MRAGNGPFRPTLPTIPGNGVGGIVRAVGEGLDPSLVGTLLTQLAKAAGATGRTAFEQLKPGGRILTYGLASGHWADITEAEAEARTIKIIRPTAAPEAMRRLTESALEAAATGTLRPVIGQRFPWPPPTPPTPRSRPGRRSGRRCS